jgi:tetratricopeptide (TPR) repeat protein
MTAGGSTGAEAVVAPLGPPAIRERPGPLGTIDHPGSTVLADVPFDVYGWVAFADPVSEVAVYLDEALVGPAECGFDRPDVARAFPDYPHAGRSGYRRRSIAAPAGRSAFELVVAATSAAGEVWRSSRSLRVAATAAEVIALTGAGEVGDLVAAAEIFISRGALAEAQAVAAVAAARFPERPEGYEAYARVMMLLAQKDPQRWSYGAAKERWQRLRERFPDRPLAYVQGGVAHVREREFDLADALLKSAVERFPLDAGALMQYADVATLRGDWGEALARWEAGLRIFPEDRIFIAGRRRALYGASSERLGGGEDSLAGSEPARTAQSEISDRELMMGFEGIGANCDFGLVQRHFGAEPLGLLRFSSAELPQLLHALATRFEGVGRPENTKLEIRSEYPEYWVGDRRFGFTMHTFIYVDKVPSDQKDDLFRKQCRRLEFLARKLVSDLENAEKILVYQRSFGLSASETQELFAALRVFGPNKLLCGVPSDAAHPAGTVEEILPDLFVGYIQTFTHDGGPLDFSSWHAVCAAVRGRYRAASRS